MGQIPRSTECVSCFHTRPNILLVDLKKLMIVCCFSTAQQYLTCYLYGSVNFKIGIHSLTIYCAKSLQISYTVINCK